MRGAARRGGGRGGANGSVRRKTTVGASSDAKTSLVDEWRAHEEDCAARVLQNQLRAFLSRQRMAKLLLSVYEKHYDPIRKQHFYVNTLTSVSTWEKPLLLARFLPGDHNIARGRVELAPKEAAQRIQRVARAFLAKKTIRQLVRENYMKLFDPDTRVFYYLNTRTGERSEQKPPFFRQRPGTAGNIAAKRDALRNATVADDDLEIEPFYFRKAVCKISSDGNPHGSGVIGRFCGILCVLTDGKTLADADTARSARAVCNYADERVAFPVLLAADALFAGIKMPEAVAARLQPLPTGAPPPQPQSPKKKTRKPQFDFALCALNEGQFLIAAGSNVQPLRFEMNDRKLGCGETESLHLGDHLEVVGHPHGKLQVLHHRQLAKLVPNSINPQHLHYDRVMETGSAGCGVFTRGGKLVGIHPFAAAKEAPTSCWCIKPILSAALVLVTPPKPFILTSCVASTGVQVYWQLPRDWTPLHGLPVEFELEICRHETLDTLHHEPFEKVYSGPRTSHHVDDLRCSTMYSLRCRAVNRMKKSRWSSAVRFITLQQVSLAWRLRHCTSVKEAVKRMQQQQGDAQTQFRSVQWIFAQLEKHEEADQVEWEVQMDGVRGDRGKPGVSNQLKFEQELVDCRGLDVFLSSMAWFPDEKATVALILRLLLKLTRLQKSTQRFMTETSRFEVLCGLLRSHTFPNEDGDNIGEKKDSGPELEIPLLCLELIGTVLRENGAAKLVFESCSGVALVLSFLTRELYRHEAAVAGECCYILAAFSYENASVKLEIVEANGLALLQRVLLEHRQESRVLYWALITTGNVAYGLDEATTRPQLEAEISSLKLVDSVCECRVHFLSRLHELELSLVAAEKHLEHLHAIHVGEETRNELDASTHLVETLKGVIADWKSSDVAEAADYALRYLLTEEQRRVQLASKRLMKKFLLRTLSMAVEKWQEVTVYERHRAIFLTFLHTVRTRQLRPAFRRWEQTTRELRKHRSILQTLGSGLAMDLTKKRKERYRMLVLQK